MNLLLVTLSVVAVNAFYWWQNLKLGELLMATQSELATQVTDLTNQVGKIGNETRTLLTQVSDLLAQIATGGNGKRRITGQRGRAQVAGAGR